MRQNFIGIVSIWVLFFGAVEDVETYIENRFKKEREAYKAPPRKRT